jgi:hypothetical protein
MGNGSENTTVPFNSITSSPGSMLKPGKILRLMEDKMAKIAKITKRNIKLLRITEVTIKKCVGQILVEK